MNIKNNTFSQRSALWNINMHSDSDKGLKLCNPPVLINYNNVLYPYPVLDGDIEGGGGTTFIEDNTFYKGSAIDLPYPNTTTTTFTITPPIIPPYVYTSPYKIEINKNFFRVPAEAVSPNAFGMLDWQTDPNNANIRDGYNFIRIGGFEKGIFNDNMWHYNYLFAQDNHLQFGENGISNKNICLAAPPASSFTPIAIIASATDADHQAGIPSTMLAKKIAEGETLWFDAHLCADKSRNYPPLNDLVYLWRLHMQKSDLDDEVRTDNTSINTPFPVPFDLVGINNVTLMTVDVTTVQTNDYRANDLTHQKITVTPTDGHRYLTFWIKDTYMGREMRPYGIYGHGYEDGCKPPPPAPPLLPAPTGFEKYVKIDGNLLWKDDVAGDEGWQYVKICLDCNGANNYTNGLLEIGLRSVTQVNATRVR